MHHKIVVTLSKLEVFVFIQTSLLVLLSSWAFGGNIWWIDTPLRIVGSCGILLSACIFWERWTRSISIWRDIALISPLFLFNLFVLISAQNPNHREMFLGGQLHLAQGGDALWLPGSARPATSLSLLWLFDGIYLSCLNIFLVPRKRSSLRMQCMVLMTNTLILSVLGSLQKLTSATGPYFSAVISPNPLFFSTFLYHNHWGTFVILSVSTSIGLVWYFSKHQVGLYRDFWHSPAFVLLIAVFFLAAAIAMSASRSCTLLVILLICGSLLSWIRKTIRSSVGTRRSALPKLLGASIAILISFGAIAWIATPMLSLRLQQTSEEIQEFVAKREINHRPTLYRDVLKMSSDRPWFGWGMGSFQYVFQSYNTQTSLEIHNIHFYANAHSDWLQCLAEFGIIGITIIALMAIVPFLLVGSYQYNDVSRYMLIGCGIVFFYAMIEFPYGCPSVVIMWWLTFFSALRLIKLESRE